MLRLYDDMVKHSITCFKGHSRGSQTWFVVLSYTYIRRYDFSGMMPKKLRNAKDDFSELLSNRLERVTIENRHAFEVIETYDSLSTWHFVDPPYVGSDCGHYEGVFGDDDLGHLLDLLAQVEGKFMLTMFPNDQIAAYADRNGWITHRIERMISASKTNRRTQEEWMVCNYDIADEQPSLGL